MIQAYQIKHPPEFLTATMDPLDLSMQLGDDESGHLLRKMHDMLMHNEPLSPIWQPVVTSTFTTNSPISEKAPDISVWDTSMLLLNSRAYESLKEKIAPEGEFLPITVDGAPYQVFHCLSFAREQKELCVRKYFQGKLMPGLETLYFDEEDIADRFLFLSKLEGGGTLYCSTHFKALVEELGLEGLKFDEDLLNPF